MISFSPSQENIETMSTTTIPKPNPENIEQTNDTNRLTHKETNLKKELECPICNDCPRQGPIHNCKSGHLLCNECHDNLKEIKKGNKDNTVKCPLCKEPFMGRSLLAENIINGILQDTPTACKYTTMGCTKIETMKQIWKHEQSECTFRTITCPGCKEKGAINSIILIHTQKSHCANVEIIDKWPATHSEPILDMSHPSNSVFKEDIHDNVWPPTMLLQRHDLSFLPYLYITRQPTGLWYFAIKGIGTQEIRNKYHVTIILDSYNPSDLNKLNLNMFSATMDIHDSRDNLDKIIQNGSYLTLADNQIQHLQTAESIFRYSINVRLKSDKNGGR